MKNKLERFVGGRLRELRQSRGLTSKAVGDRIGMPHPHLRSLELGKYSMTLRTLAKLCSEYAIAPHELLDPNVYLPQEGEEDVSSDKEAR